METNYEIGKRIAEVLYGAIFDTNGRIRKEMGSEEIKAMMAGIIEFELTEGGEDDPDDDDRSE